MIEDKSGTYIMDIINESEYALDAIGRLNFAYANLNRLSKGSRQYTAFFKEVFDAIDIFLSHAGVLSQLLWQKFPNQTPMQAGGDKREMCLTQKGFRLDVKTRKRWGLGAEHILNDTRFRTYCDDDLMPGGSEETFHDENVCFIGYWDTMTYLQREEIRQYDPLSRNYSYYGETFQIHEMATAIYLLLFYARRDLKKYSSMIDQSMN
jgi:hypothetical protein